MQTEHVNCDLCGTDDYIVLWDKSEHEKAGKLRSVVIRDEQNNIIQGRNVMCKRCGLVYVTPRMSRGELDRFYAEDYRKIYKGGNSLEAEKRHAETAYKLISGLQGKALDIGCSTGELVKKTNFYGCGFGIEPNREHCEIAKAAGLNVENCTIEDYSPGFKFNIITMLNALEHVTSPTAVLNKIHSLLNDGGHALISVPNLTSTTINIPVDAFLSNAHLFNFTAHALGIMMCKCGLAPEKVWLIPEEMGEKVYMLARKDVAHEIIFDDNIGQRIEITKAFLEYADRVFLLKQILNGGI